MADRRRQVGQRRRATDESRVEQAVDAAREAVRRSSNGREGIDARAVGDDREAVDASETDVDEEAADRVGGGPARSRIDEARARIKELTAVQKERLKEANTREALRDALAAAAATSAGAGSRPGSGSQGDDVGSRAARSAQIGSPVQSGLRPMGDERQVSEMARSAAAETNQLLDFSDSGTGSGGGADFGIGVSATGNGNGMGALSVGAGGGADLLYGSDSDGDRGDSATDEGDPLGFGVSTEGLL
jgi:hypothetical protein